MSVETWKKEFYRTSRKSDYFSKMSWLRALDHSIRKWSGLSPENLKKHKVRLIDDDLANVDDEFGERFTFTADTCALCRKCDTPGLTGPDCEKCPLYKSLGNHQCDDNYQGANIIFSSPYSKLYDGEYLPMLNALKKAKEQLLAKKN